MPTDPYAIDAPFYDAIHDDFQDDTGFWLAFAGQTDAPVLIVGCGTGRIAVPLAAAGSRVTGIDPSPKMLERARQRAAREEVAVEWVEATLFEGRLEQESFGLVLVPADVFLYCRDADDQLAWLRAARELLTFNGRLILDLPGPALWLDPATNGQPLLVFRGESADGQRFEAWHVHEDDLAEQSRWLQVSYETIANDGAVRRLRSEHQLRYIYPAELGHLLSRTGLRLVDLYGDYDAGVLSNESERMIAIAERDDA